MNPTAAPAAPVKDFLSILDLHSVATNVRLHGTSRGINSCG